MTNDKIQNRIGSRLGLALLYLLTLLCLGCVSYYSLTEWRVTIDRQIHLQTQLAASTALNIAQRQRLLQQAALEANALAERAIARTLASFSFSAIGFLLVYYLLNLQLQRELAERQRAQEALRQAEAKYRSIFENAIEGIFQTTPEGRYLTANPMLAKIYGYSSTAELMANISDLGQQLYVAPHRRDEFVRLLQQHDTVAGFESQVYRQDGQVIWIAEQARIVRDENGKPLYYEGIVEDITQRKHAEEERAKLISILEATLDFVATADLDERVHYLNSSARKIFGLDRDREVVDLHLSHLHPAWAYDLLHREAIPTAIQHGVWVGETAILSHDGREIPVSQLLIAHKSSQGKVKLLSTIARDLTQRLQIEASLREAERRWRSLLENVRLVVVGLDRQGIVEYVNPFFLELVEYTSEEVLGKNWYEVFLPPHQRQRVREHFLQLQQQGLHGYYQHSILTKSGQERLIAWNNTILRDLQGEAIATLSIGEDITERYAIERMKDEFVSVVSHELRTPLTSIHGALNLLSSGLIDARSDRGRRVIDIASEGADRLVRLVNDILELERLESGKISLIQRACNAAELLEKATDLMQVMANRAKITLSVVSEDIQLNVDGDRIIQVLTNLLGNAIKFSPEGSKVELTVKAIEGGENSELNSASAPPTKTILFTVTDQGRGIPADKLESIFERFHQVDASDSRKKGGTGLGLAICRSIVQQHGGRIWAESVLGKGSSFYFTLPKLSAEF
jgi:PAS domain S-box-containing protein